MGITTNYQATSSLGLLSDPSSEDNTELGLYVYHRGRYGPIVLEPSIRAQYYASLGAFRLEPRIGAKINITSFLRFKVAGGLYSQNLISSVNERDIVNLFVGFVGAPREQVYRYEGGKWIATESKLQTSIHAIGGFEVSANTKLKFNIEPYYKWFPQIININNSRTSVNEPLYIAEKGRAYGLDLSGTYDNRQLYAFLGYSYGLVDRNDGVQTYFASFDRRHNLNSIVSYRFKLGGSKENDKIKNRTKYPLEASLRWNLGSGFPFTRTQGFFAQQNFTQGLSSDYLTDNNTPNTSLGIRYEEDINLGRLPYYHRLDLSVKYTLDLVKHMKLEIAASVTNAYDRKNIFYFNRISYERINQLPLMPAINLNLKF